MWHIAIQEGQLEDVRRTVQEQAEAARRWLQMRADEQLRREKEAYGKAERNRLLRVRWAGPTRRPRPSHFLPLPHGQLVCGPAAQSPAPSPSPPPLTSR